MFDTLQVNILASSIIEDEDEDEALSAQSGSASLDWKCQQPNKGHL
ncbi:hypothetical protein [Aeromonas hydrophila]|nr:hypothetical protein [Aeromonas hydrophila]